MRSENMAKLAIRGKPLGKCVWRKERPVYRNGSMGAQSNCPNYVWNMLSLASMQSEGTMQMGDIHKKNL